ncbi:TPA: hypothetical protein RTH13_000748 [Campylobacter jejuni]|nr:hypothetical protein [Campylobacter jejuni]HDZ5087028.1 hypothetical protein [Campylobacter jejuni]HDZ5090287.1 hypothetical protein [Campylobacter jejuni]HDZ5091891.1 hypothetical protein [Campylobacter jejuni]HDZ5096362.1 hypothetical protein [Campylobacter jejuni]
MLKKIMRAKAEDFLRNLDLQREQSVKVIFEDEESSLLVGLSLAKRNFENLLRHFEDKEDYFKRK